MFIPLCVLIMLIIAGCESDVTGPATEAEPIEETEEKAEAALRLSNTGSLNLPDEADSYVLRVGVNLFFGDLPPEGESREISATIPRGRHFVGLILYNGGSGEAFAFARTEEGVSFPVGETVQVSLADKFIDFTGEVSIGGVNRPGNDLVFRYDSAVYEEGVLNYFLPGPRDWTYYAASPFVGIEDAEREDTQFRLNLASSSRGPVGFGSAENYIMVTEELQESMYARWAFDVQNEWRNGDQGPKRFYQPHLSEPPFDVHELMSTIDVEFLETE